MIVAVRGDLPFGAREVKREPGGVVLAYGEATGHAHRIRSRQAVLFERGGERFLRVNAPVDLTHEEHGPIHLEPGLYRVLRQREYRPNARPSEVAD